MNKCLALLAPQEFNNEGVHGTAEHSIAFKLTCWMYAGNQTSIVPKCSTSDTRAARFHGIGAALATLSLTPQEDPT